MSHLFPAHLSRDNNRPELVQALFEQEANGTKIVIASRDQETELYAIDGLYRGYAAEAGIAKEITPKAGAAKKIAAKAGGALQGSLF